MLFQCNSLDFSEEFSFIYTLFLLTTFQGYGKEKSEKKLSIEHFAKYPDLEREMQRMERYRE